MSDTTTVLNNLAHPATFDLMGAYKNAAQTANAIWANRLSQAQQAQGQNAIDAIDPATGQMSQAAYGAAMRNSGPAAALGAQDSMQKAQTLSTNQLGFNDSQQTVIARGVGALINMPEEMQTSAAYKAQIET